MTAVTTELQIPWTESPFFEDLLKQADLESVTKEKIRFFAQNGYLLLDLASDEFNVTATDIAQSLESEHEAHGSPLQDAWQYQKSVLRLATHPQIQKWLNLLYGRQPIPFRTLNFNYGTERATHSDLIHFNSVPQRFMAGVWWALEDVNQDNGPLYYYPGSHRLPIYDLHDMGLPLDEATNDEKYTKYEEFVADLTQRLDLRKEVVNMRRGQVLIFAANLLHGEESIRNEGATRCSQMVHYYFEGCRYYNPLNSNVFQGKVDWRQIRNVATGKPVTHQYNGKAVSLPMKTRLRSALDNLMHHSGTEKKPFQALKQAFNRSKR